MRALGGPRRLKLALAVVAGVALGLWPAGTRPAEGARKPRPPRPTTTVLWSFTGDGRVTSAPVTANGYVYVGSAVPAPDEHNVSQLLPGMAIGLGHLVVPGTNTLTVYGD